MRANPCSHVPIQSKSIQEACVLLYQQNEDKLSFIASGVLNVNEHIVVMFPQTVVYRAYANVYMLYTNMQI